MSDSVQHNSMRFLNDLMNELDSGIDTNGQQVIKINDEIPRIENAIQELKSQRFSAKNIGKEFGKQFLKGMVFKALNVPLDYLEGSTSEIDEKIYKLQDLEKKTRQHKSELEERVIPGLGLLKNEIAEINHGLETNPEKAVELDVVLNSSRWKDPHEVVRDMATSLFGKTNIANMTKKDTGDLKFTVEQYIIDQNMDENTVSESEKPPKKSVWERLGW